MALLLVLLQSALCLPTEKANPTDEQLVFKLADHIEVNGVRLAGLNCTLKGPLRKLCSNITEVTCEKKQNKIQFCLVSNEDSIFHGRQVAVQSTVCADKTRRYGNCTLLFRPPTANALKQKVMSQLGSKKTFEIRDSFDDPFFRDRKNPFDDPFFRDRKDPFDDPFFRDRKDPFDDPFFRNPNDRRSKMKSESNFFLVCFGIVFGLM